MLKNYLTIAIRNLMRHKLYSAINIIGLSIGLAFCILTFLFVREEWTYDAFHTKADRIFRIYTSNSLGASPGLPDPLGPALSEAFPDIRTVRVTGFSRPVLWEGKAFREAFCFADPEFLDVFTFPLVRGDSETALRNRHAVILTETAAQKYFGDENPLDQTLSVQAGTRLSEIQDFIVTGVAKAMPKNSSLRFDFLVPFEAAGKSQGWHTSYVQTYAWLPDFITPEQIAMHLPERVVNGLGKTTQLGFQPLREVYLNSGNRGPTPRSKPVYSYALAGIAALVLTIACVNFTTLSIGRSFARAREVGLRKVVGATRMQIAKQFLGESILLSFLALVIGIALVELLLPAFNNLTGQNLALWDRTTGELFIGLCVLMLIAGMAAGSYPAFVLSRFHPIGALKNRLNYGNSGFLGHSLVIFQFAMSILLISGAGLMTRQVTFLRTKPLGFEHELVVAFWTWEVREHNPKFLEVYRNELLQHPGVLGATETSHTLNNMVRNWAAVAYQGKEIGNLDAVYIGDDFLETMGIDLLEGQDFSRERDKQAVIVNQALVRHLGWDAPIGQTLQIERRDRTVIGVVEDFHIRSLHHKIEPTILLPGNIHTRLMVRIRPEDVPGTLAFLETTWKKLAPDFPFSFSFLDEEIDRQYREETQWSRITGYAAFFAIFISALGMFGLVSLTVVRRTKEIGIRKVLGASASGIVLMLSRDFVKLVLIANLIAWPIAYYAMNRWLENFAYRMDLGWEVFVLSGGLALFIALLTVSGQAWKAARANPVDALRNE